MVSNGGCFSSSSCRSESPEDRCLGMSSGGRGRLGSAVPLFILLKLLSGWNGWLPHSMEECMKPEGSSSVRVSGVQQTLHSHSTAGARAAEGGDPSAELRAEVHVLQS